MAGPRGRFVWYELMTSDPEGAKAFYQGVVGWGIQKAEGMDYHMFTADGVPYAGLFALPEEMRANGVPPHWMGYVGVADVDAELARAEGLGCSVLSPVHDIPEVGRFAVIADPQGAAIALYQPAPGTQGGERTLRSPGHVGWHELMTDDAGAAIAFYGEMFGWTRGEEMDMGAMGAYRIFEVDGEQTGGMMNRPPEMPMSAWLYYFNVGDIDAAAERVGAGGGQVLHGPVEVPGGGWILQAMDPQGGMFALFGRRG